MAGKICCLTVCGAWLNVAPVASFPAQTKSLEKVSQNSMSKKNVKQKSGSGASKPASASAQPSADLGRRKFVLLGVGAVAVAGVGLAGAYNAGWFDAATPETASTAAKVGGKNLAPATVTADAQNALRVCDEMLAHYARDLNNPSALIHAVRGFGKGFKLADGSSAVDYLCAQFTAEKDVNGKRCIYFKRDAEVHENSFLKTFLEAGVSQDQPVSVGANRYTLREVAESGKLLFRCDPKDLFKYDARQFRYDTAYVAPTVPGQPAPDGRGELLHEHLPWGLIAFSHLLPPDKAAWTNAFGEPINLSEVIDRSLAEYEQTCSLGQKELVSGQTAPKEFREAIKKYSCFGLHSAYSYLACLQQGHKQNNLAERVAQMLDIVTYRLKGDAEAITAEYAEQGQGTPPALVEAFRQRALVKLYGHAFESINYAKWHNLVSFTASQQRRIEAGEQAFYDSLVKLRAMDWGMLRKTLGDKFVSDIVIALGHASRALKLLTPQNPDTIA